MITWGISANSHDAALAVFTKEGLEFASHSERFSGLKNDPHLNDKIIDYALQWGEADEVIWYENPFKKSIRQIYAGQGFNFNKNSTRRYLGSYGIHAPVFNISHHHSHAAAGYYTSPFSEATVLCIDSIGEFETLTIWQGKRDQLKKIYSQKFPHSIGLWYSAMTQRIGLTANEDEYILMGMAAYGDSRVYRNQIMHDFFESKTLPIKFKHNLHRGCNWWRPELNDDHNFNIAAGTQWVYETILDNILQWCKQNTDSKNLVIMGGCALNCSANHLAYKYFDDVWIMPNPGAPPIHVAATLRSSPIIIMAKKASSKLLAYSVRKACSGVAFRSSTVISASMPGAMVPILSSRYSASAAPRVARKKACKAVRE